MLEQYVSHTSFPLHVPAILTLMPRPVFCEPLKTPTCLTCSSHLTLSPALTVQPVVVPRQKKKKKKKLLGSGMATPASGADTPAG